MPRMIPEVITLRGSGHGFAVVAWDDGFAVDPESGRRIVGLLGGHQLEMYIEHPSQYRVFYYARTMHGVSQDDVMGNGIRIGSVNWYQEPPNWYQEPPPVTNLQPCERCRQTLPSNSFPALSSRYRGLRGRCLCDTCLNELTRQLDILEAQRQQAHRSDSQTCILCGGIFSNQGGRIWSDIDPRWVCDACYVREHGSHQWQNLRLAEQETHRLRIEQGLQTIEMSSAKKVTKVKLAKKTERRLALDKDI